MAKERLENCNEGMIAKQDDGDDSEKEATTMSNSQYIITFGPDEYPPSICLLFLRWHILVVLFPYAILLDRLSGVGDADSQPILVTIHYLGLHFASRLCGPSTIAEELRLRLLT